MQISLTKDGFAFQIDPEKNDAIVFVDIPYAAVKLENAKADAAGNLVFSGDIGFRTIFNGAEFSMEKLGYGLNTKNEFKVNGVKATGSFDTAKLMALELASISGEVNTFKGEERYAFELELNAFDLFETEASLALERSKKDGSLIPDELWFFVKSSPGIPLVPPVPVGQLNGGGAGFKDLAKTVNGDYFAIPPIKLRGTLTDTAAESAIHNFALNLRPLLMQPPVKGFVTMGLDPGYAHGCKVAVIDATGKVLDTTVVYPTFSERKKQEAIDTLKRLIDKHGVKHLAIGNGTASRETEAMAVEMIHKLGGGVSYMIVNEAGASVYSASKLAAEEFPQYDVNLRSAVSIARRLQDPLAELVKIDPKAIGVGQYQHDMPEKELDAALGGVVEACVNAVGVDLNTASAPLLRRVAGVSAATAKNIVAWREEEGAFTSRAQLKKVKGLGPKAYEQCAGFLRLPEAKNRLDATAVHPESYAAAKALLDACGYTAAEIGTDKLAGLPGVVRAKGAGTLCEALGVGEPTLNDIVAELCKPGRDVRDSLPKPLLRSDVMGLDDLKPGMELTGTVRNVIDFGAFVDLGVHQDGLVHVSQISDKFIKHPREVLKVGDIVRVKVLNVDTAKKRIALTMKGVPQQN